MKTSLTIKYSEIVQIPNSKVVIRKNGKSFNAIATWDTGSVCSIIGMNVVETLDLKPEYGHELITSSKREISAVYHIDIEFEQGILLKDVLVHDLANLNAQGIDMLIGMDIISLGDFAISNFDNHTQLTFRIPSTENLDFSQ